MYSKLSVTIDSDVDLCLITNQRVKVERVGEKSFQFTSYMRMPRCMMYPFVLRLIKRKFGQYQYILGCCSKPSTIIYLTTIHGVSIVG